MLIAIVLTTCDSAIGILCKPLELSANHDLRIKMLHTWLKSMLDSMQISLVHIGSGQGWKT